MELMCNAVFEGGGVRGIGHVGAASVLEKAGYRMQHLIGSSAGAIVASLLVSGYRTHELQEIIENLDYLKFKQENFLSRFGVPGKLASLCKNYGIYSADYFESWLSDLLKKKGITSFGDIKTSYAQQTPCQWRLQVTASDVTDQRLLILPRDLADFGIDPDSFSIAKAVRMSMSIPLFYKPFHLKSSDGKDHLIVDGGLLSNYPIWIFDDEEHPCSYPTIGFKFTDDIHMAPCSQKMFPPDFIRYMRMLVSTALDGADKQHISESGGDFARTVAIPVIIYPNGKTIKISATYFEINREESFLLFQNGIHAAEHFLKNWNYANWKNHYSLH